jgi:hypothetical protein
MGPVRPGPCRSPARRSHRLGPRSGRPHQPSEGRPGLSFGPVRFDDVPGRRRPGQGPTRRPSTPATAIRPDQPTGHRPRKPLSPAPTHCPAPRPGGPLGSGPDRRSPITTPSAARTTPITTTPDLQTPIPSGRENHQEPAGGPAGFSVEGSAEKTVPRDREPVGTGPVPASAPMATTNLPDRATIR